MSVKSDPAWQPSAEAANAIRIIAAQKIELALRKLSDHGEALMRIPELTENAVRPDGDIPLHPLTIAVANYRQGKQTSNDVAIMADVFRQWQPSLDRAYGRSDQTPVADATDGKVSKDVVLDILIAVNDVISAATQLGKLPPVPPAVDREPDMQVNGTRIWFK